MDLTTIRLEVRERLGELTADFFTDDEVTRAINEAVRRFSNEERWPWLLTEHTGELEAGEDDYDLPEDIAPNRVFNMTVDDDSLIRARPLERVDPYEGFRLRHAYDGHTGCPRYYYTHNTNLQADDEGPITFTAKLIPTPDLAYTVEAQYYFVPIELSGGGDEPAVPVEYQDAIPAWAAGKLFLKEFQISQKAQEQFSIYGNIVQQARAEYMEPNTDMTSAWGREHPGERKYFSEWDYVMGRIGGSGLGS